MTNSSVAPRLERLELTSKPTVVITERLKRQIDFLHNNVGNKEWSGELITREEGTINDLDNWRIICEDIFLCDVGTGGYTEYEVDKGGFKAPDIVELYEKYLGLLDGELKNHHIHTHHGMGAFFSGTDWQQLEDRAVSSNYFMMLVVDFKETYKAKVAFKATLESGKNRKIKFANNLDGYNDIILAGDSSEDVLVWMDCNIEWEAVDIHLPEGFSERYDRVKKAIEDEKKPKYSPPAHVTNPCPTYPSTTQREFEWEGSYGKWKNENRGRKNKNVMEMTDKEWANYNDGGSSFIFTRGDAHVILNAVLDITHEKNYNSPLGKLFAKSHSFNNVPMVQEYANNFVISMRECFDIIYIGADEDDYADLIEQVLNVLDNFKYDRLISAIYDELMDLQELIDKQEVKTIF